MIMVCSLYEYLSEFGHSHTPRDDPLAPSFAISREAATPEAVIDIVDAPRYLLSTGQIRLAACQFKHVAGAQEFE